MGYLVATLTHVFTCDRGANVSLRDVTIAQMKNGARECEWRHAPEARGGFGEFWRKLVELRLDTKQNGSTFGARRGETNLHVTGAARDGGGGRWKSQNRKNVYLSPYVDEPLNSKVIKSFVPELRSRKCFSCFEIPMLYIYIYIYIYIYMLYMNILMNIIYTFRISVSGYGTDRP